MDSSKKILLTTIGIAILIVFVTGVTFAFFNYTRTGAGNTIRVGRISFVTRQTSTINLVNVFPIDSEDVDTDTDNVDEVVIEIEGDTDYVDGIEYLVSSVDSSIYTSSGVQVPISLDIEVAGLGTENANYFTARDSKNANIYKQIVGDTLVGDQMLLVGYIKKNTTNGEAEGVDGSITIKAYFDKDKILISDTYDGTESDNIGTTNSMAQGKTVITTAEWNALQSSGLSFKVKVEANEGIWVNGSLEEIMRKSAVMDNINSTYVNNSTPGINFGAVSGDTNGKGVYMRAGTENDAYPIMYYRGAIDNNVYFAGKCWQIIRTTETGGTKLIYNGENTGTADEPACENTTGTDRQITLNLSGTDINTFQFSGSNLYNSPAYNGYTYNTPVYSATNGNYASGSKFGNNITWDGTNYTITDVSDSIDDNHHYTCGTANTTTCSSIRYYFAYFTVSNYNYYMYFNLTNGKTIENVVSESLENGTTESNVKAMVEQWYEENIDSTEYDAKIEDAVYCNDRSIYQLGGLNPNGGTLTNTPSTVFMYSGNKRNYVDYNPSTKCSRPQDAFTKESSNGNGLLDYPVGLITIDEIAMAGGKIETANANFYLTTGANYWSLSPRNFAIYGSANEFSVFSAGTLAANRVDGTLGLRPVVSLKPGQLITKGTGTVNDPYVIE